MIGKIAGGEVEDTQDDVSSAAAQMGNRLNSAAVTAENAARQICC